MLFPLSAGRRAGGSLPGKFPNANDLNLSLFYLRVGGRVRFYPLQSVASGASHRWWWAHFR